MTSGTHSRLRRGVMIPALAAGLLAAGGGSALATQGGAAPAARNAAPAASKAAPAARNAVPGARHAAQAATAAAVPAMLAAGQTGPRSAVPWQQVGAGWELAQYDGGSAAYVHHPKKGQTTLYLVDPRGGRYELYRWTAANYPQLLDWSGDKTRALLAAGSKVEQITLATGKVSRFSVKGSLPLSYTRPDGQNLLALHAMGDGQIVRYNLRGQVQKVLADAGPGESALESPDGTEVVLPGVNGVRLVSNTGHAIRTLRAGYPQGSCAPVRWWNSATVLAACFEQTTGPERLYRVPVSGQPAAALTPWRNGRGADPLGDDNGWRLRSGLYLQAPIGCGSQQIVKQQASGSAKLVTVPGTNGNDNHVITASGARLLVQVQTGCLGSASLLWFNPGTRSVQMLIKAPKTIRGVVATVPFDMKPAKA